METVTHDGERHPWSRLSEPTFTPLSTVLRERRLVTFDSDDEDAAAHTLPPAGPADPATDADASTSAIAPLEIAYVSQGRVNSVEIDLAREDLSCALRGLSTDTWTALLDDDDRRKLSAYLPALEGWKGLGHDEAQHLNVKALLSGENFHFGNPVAMVDSRLNKGFLTAQAVVAREAKHRVAFDQFDHRRQVLTRSRLQELKRQRADANDAPPQAWKKIRLASEDGRAATQGQSTSNLITEQTSIFLAIRKAFQNEQLTAKQVAEKLQAGSSKLSYSFEGPPLFITFNRFIEAALSFLSAPQAASGESNHWSSAQFLKSNAAGLYEWCGGGVSQTKDVETRSLLLLEHVFQEPVTSDFLNTTSTSSAVKATRKRREEILLRRAREALGIEDSVSSHQSRHEESSLLKQALAIRTRSETGIDQHQLEEQQRMRYSLEHQAFAYTDPRTRKQWTVGPAYETEPPSLHALREKLLTTEVPPTVNLLSLVYDACACLPGGLGTRTDIRTNFVRSRFVKPDAKEATIDEAITMALNVLETQPPPQTSTPCMQFDAESFCWRYVHAAIEWPAAALKAPMKSDCETTSKPVTPSKMCMKDLLH